MKRALALVLKALFFVSGATGLVYEIVWMRQLVLVFGSTTYAVSAVLSAFMLGLAIGSFAIGRAADRGTNLIRLYGALEIGVGLYAFVAPALLRGAAPAVARALGLDPGNSVTSICVRFTGALVVLLPPTLLMGGTLPVLGRLFSPGGGDPSRSIGGLYALNTFGAVMGTFVAGFVMLPNLGARKATFITAAVNIGLGVAALLLSNLRAAAESGSRSLAGLAAAAATTDSSAAAVAAATGGAGSTASTTAPAAAADLAANAANTSVAALPALAAATASSVSAAAPPSAHAATTTSAAPGAVAATATAGLTGTTVPAGLAARAGVTDSRAASSPSASRARPEAEATTSIVDAPAGSGRAANVLLVFALSGFAAMVYEVTWTRVLSQTIGSSVYGFTMMLIAFLIGLSSGAWAFARFVSARPSSRPERVLAADLACVGLAAWLTSLLFAHLPYWFSLIHSATGGAAGPMIAGEFLLCLLVMLPATFFMGGIFPLVLRLHASGTEAVASRVGEAYASNTAGTVLGSIAAGLLILPCFGIRLALISACSISLLLSGWVLCAALRGWKARLAAPALTILVCVAFQILTPPWDPQLMNSGVYYDPEIVPAGATLEGFRSYLKEQDEVLFYREGTTASVLVGRERASGYTYVRVNGKTDASTGLDMQTQVLLGQLPMLFHPDPRRALVIGLGSGVSVASVATHAVETIRVLEVEPAMLEACRYFDAYNRNVLSDPRVTVSIGDARNDLLLREETYDVIVSEPSNPWMTVASNLFTRDFFTLAKTRLNKGGVFGQWFQVYSLAPADIRSLLGTFRSVFPHVLVFWVRDSTDLVVLGSEQPFPLDYETLAKRSSDVSVAIDLGRIEAPKPEDFLSYLYMISPGLEEFVDGAPANTDDNALIEFSAPLALYADLVPISEDEIRRHSVRITNLVTGLPIEPAARREAYLNFAQALLRLGRPWAAMAALRSAESLGANERSASLRSAIEARLKSS